MSASGQGPTERAKQWARVNLENVVGAKLHKHDMCGWNSKGLANLTVKEEYGGWEWRTLSSAVKKLWPSVVKIRGEKGKTDYLKDVRLKSSRYRYPYCLLFVLLRLKFVGFLFCPLRIKLVVVVVARASSFSLRKIFVVVAVARASRDLLS